MAALIPAILAALPSIESGAEHLWAFLASARAAGQQTGEWTASMDAKYIPALQAQALRSLYQPDKPKLT